MDAFGTTAYKLQRFENSRFAGPVGANKDRERIRLDEFDSFNGLEIFDDQAFDIHKKVCKSVSADARVKHMRQHLLTYQLNRLDQ